MKAIKKTLAMLLAVVMVMGLSITAFAQDVAVNNDTADNGTITITNTTEGQTYKLYKIFDATYSGTGDDAKVSYTFTKTESNTDLYNALTADTSPFALTASANDSSVYVVTLKTTEQTTYEAATYDSASSETYYTYDENSETYVEVEDPANATGQLYVQVKKTVNAYTDPQIIAFIEGIADKLTVLDTTVANSDGKIKYTGLAYGYYYITSTLGTLVTIDSAIPNVEVVDKNTAPTNEKTVEEDSDSKYGSSNTADLGDTVNFKSTITAYAGAEGYVLHDKMSTGLTFDSTSVKVTVGTTELTAYVAPAEGEDEPTNWDYKVVVPGTETGEGVTACTFEVVFNQTYLDTITEKTTIVVSYSATVNEKAVIGDTGNGNSSTLEYGDGATTTTSTTTTYVYGFDLLKYSGVDEDNKKITLDGAEFTLTRSGETEALYFVKSTKTVDEETVTVYTLAESTDTNASQTITAGQITIEGLDAGEYTLTETKAPNGYNPLTNSVAVVIGQNTEGTTPTMTLTQDGETADEIEVLNQSGTELPSTGGIGTTIFYVVGSILVIGAAVLLITKKRMSGAEK